jgi:2-iminobutanoate/2-iminopropanoate deaminase
MTDRRVIQIPNAPAPVAPYSQAIVRGGLVFCSGAVGTNPATGELVDGGAPGQAAQALDNIAAILAAADSGLDLVLKTSIFLVEMADWAPVNEVYRERMPQPYPARTTVVVQALPLGARVEIEVLAAVRSEPS